MKILMPNITGISLNLINKDITKHLMSKGHFVEAISIDFTKTEEDTVTHKYDVLLQHYVAENFKYNANKKILIQPVDGSKINPDHVKNINTYDLILTPANSCKKILIESGVPEERIEVVPNYYSDITKDNEYFKNNFKTKKYTFYTETTGIERKNVKNIIKYFAKNFSTEDNLRLIVKTNASPKVFEEIKCSLMDFEIYTNPLKLSIPEIVFINNFLTDDDLNSIMMNIDCYICLSYMEGFCIPLLNAAYLKKDIITLDSELSGYMDFLDKDNAILLPVSRIKIKQDSGSILIYSKDCEWEEPNYNDYMMALTKCYKGEYEFNKYHDFDNFSKEMVMNQYEKFITNNGN